MHQHEQSVSRAFNRAAATYNQFASMQTAAGLALIQQLNTRESNFTNILDAGCGTGTVTSMLANSFPHANIQAIDISSALLEQATKLSANIKWQLQDFNDVHTKHDLIFSNMALHWSRSLTHTFDIFHQALVENGVIAFTLPLNGTFSELPATLSMQEFFTHEQIISFMQNSGFQVIYTNCVTYREYFDDTLSALRSIKSTGTCHVNKRRHTALRGKDFLRSLSFMQLTYVTGFFIGVKNHE